MSCTSFLLLITDFKDYLYRILQLSIVFIIASSQKYIFFGVLSLNKEIYILTMTVDEKEKVIIVRYGASTYREI